jgi:uncharacterized damage-inducible protein DinB
MTDPSLQFLAESRRFLTDDYMPKIERCVAQLTDEQIWSRANEASNSIGNLVLHLTRSSRYWASDVIDVVPTGRVRQREFDERKQIPSGELLAALRTAMSDVDRRLAGIRAETLLETRKARDEEFTVLWCAYHIVEHFSYHTGQILSMAKGMIGAGAGGEA